MTQGWEQRRPCATRWRGVGPSAYPSTGEYDASRPGRESAEIEIDVYSFVDEQYGWAVARQGEDFALVRSADGGRTWQQLEPTVGE